MEAAAGVGSTRATDTRQQQQGAETHQAPNAMQGPSPQWPPTRWRARNLTRRRNCTDPVGHEHDRHPMGKSARTAIIQNQIAVGNYSAPIVNPFASSSRRQLFVQGRKETLKPSSPTSDCKSHNQRRARRPKIAPTCVSTCAAAPAEGGSTTRGAHTQKLQQGTRVSQAPDATQGPSPRLPPTRRRFQSAIVRAHTM